MDSQSQPSRPIFAEGMTGASFNLEFSTGGWSVEPEASEDVSRQKISTLSQLVEQMQSALKLWMEWNRAYHELSGLMYSHRYDVGRLESLADELDRLRHRAANMTAQLLSRQQDETTSAHSLSRRDIGEDVPD
ncbi:MAG: hypothetical protein GYA33_04600 [Thermogutta sp.]|nr:hypothetical protein [Thermogutta sp.]